MALYNYSKYNSNVTPYYMTAPQTNFVAELNMFREPIASGTWTYGSGYSLNTSTGVISLTGTITRGVNQSPPVGYYHLGSGEVKKILSATALLNGSYYHYVDIYYVVGGWYSIGSFITTLVAEDGTYPINGMHSDGYWYVRNAAVFPTINARVGGVIKTGSNGWVRVDGALRVINSMWIRVGGVLKKI